MPLDVDLAGIRALVVDDDMALRRIVRRTLAEWGASVTDVDSGVRALAELKRARDDREPFQLILLDATLPAVNGFEVAERLREYPNELRGTILLLGASPHRSEIARATEIGAGGHLVKPMTRADLAAAVAPIAAPLARGSGGASAEPRRIRILLAEDSPEARQIIRYYLESPEMAIDAAENGSVAVDLFRLAAYDVVLMDIQMPVFDGYRSMQEMRAWEQKHGLRRTPIVAITAFAETEDAQKCLRAGFDGYFTKPIHKDKLLAAVRRHGKRPA